jgi:hypothetical protein
VVIVNDDNNIVLYLNNKLFTPPAFFFPFELQCLTRALVQVVVGMPAVQKNGGVSCSVRPSTFENPIRRELKQSDIARECEIAQEHF